MQQTHEALAASIRLQVKAAEAAQAKGGHSKIYGNGMWNGCWAIAQEAADHFEKSNSGFDRGQFFFSCGLSC